MFHTLCCLASCLGVVAGGRSQRRLLTHGTRCAEVLQHAQVVQVKDMETYAFPFDHVHWLCNSLFMMHVITPSASWRDPLPPTGFSAIVRRGAP
jgi:hypothetical protein